MRQSKSRRRNSENMGRSSGSHHGRRSSPLSVESWDDLLRDAESEMEAEARLSCSHPVLRPAYIRPLLIGAICLVLVSWLGSDEFQIVSSNQSDQTTSLYQPREEIQRTEARGGPSQATLSLQSSISAPSGSLRPGIRTGAVGEVEQTTSEQAALLTTESSKPHRILSLGGSTTWGAKLESRSEAYPHVLAERLGPNWTTLNLAVRATGASYASQCIETMIREGLARSDSIKSDRDYDVVLIEYSLNGLEGMGLLMERLRRRYPDAVFVYVHLWSLRMSVHNAVTNEKPRLVLNQGLKFTEADEKISSMLADPAATWAWSDNMVGDSKQVSMEALETLSKAHGLVYEFPRPEIPQLAMTEQWFGPDYHHLSAKGHSIVASGLFELLRRPGPKAPPLTDLRFQDHSWGKGDQCYSWYENGESSPVNVTGGAMKMFVKPDKWALHVGQRFGAEASLDFPNTSDEAQPLELFLMSWGDPSIYPRSTVALKSAGTDGSESTMVLDPLHPVRAQRIYHVTNTVHVGWASPGRIRVRLTPNETTERPLRVTGIVMCGACVEMDGSYLNRAATDNHP